MAYLGKTALCGRGQKGLQKPLRVRQAAQWFKAGFYREICGGSKALKRLKKLFKRTSKRLLR
jgi:hypothetical protein